MTAIDKMTAAEVVAELRSDSTLNKVRAIFSKWSATIENAGLQRKPLSPVEARRMELNAAAEILDAMAEAPGRHQMPPPALLPDCMMPDGAEPCKGYQQIQKHVEHLQAKLTCMCGSPVAEHGMGGGHSPVSMYDYALEKAEECAAELEAVLREVNAAVDLSHCAVWPRVRALLAKPAEAKK